MPVFREFIFHFYRILWEVRIVILGLFAHIILGAWIISIVEHIPFGDSCYFSFVTGLTIGYGDIVAKTIIGRIVALLIGLIGIIYTGIIVAAAVIALREVYSKGTVIEKLLDEKE